MVIKHVWGWGMTKPRPAARRSADALRSGQVDGKSAREECRKG
jgi:hypothetical protein